MRRRSSRPSGTGPSTPTVADDLFHRFPNLRIASVENGSTYLRGLFGRLQVVARKMNG